MDRDTITRLARQAGFVGFDGYNKCLRDFAALVAAAEREECAKVAESYEPVCDTCPSGVANAIRSKT